MQKLQTNSKKEKSDYTKLNNILKGFEGREADLIPVLQKVQDGYGYVPEFTVDVIAEALKMYPSKIYGVITFYAQFSTEPRGKNIIRICRGTACHIRGVESILRALEDELGVKENETTKDYKFTLETVACLGACALAPIMMINQTYYGKLTPQRIEGILKQY